MKAIYINLDPYLAAFAAWLKGGKVGPAPKFDPLPLAVTIPLGESVGIYLPVEAYMGEPSQQTVDVDGTTIRCNDLTIQSLSDAISVDETPGFSAVAPSLKYAVFAVAATEKSVVVTLADEDGDYEVSIPLTVLVRRETASGPVDLVDFTPPASAIAAGTDLKGAKFDGNEIVAAAGTGALSAPAAGG